MTSLAYKYFLINTLTKIQSKDLRFGEFNNCLMEIARDEHNKRIPQMEKEEIGSIGI